MSVLSKQQNDRNTVGLARADYLVQKFRSNLPPSSLWHEKRFAHAQLESIAIVSAGGLYDINTFDRFSSAFKARPEMLVLPDLGISVTHVDGSNEALPKASIERLLLDASDEFDRLLAADRVSAISLIRRVTVTIDFSLPSLNVDEYAHETFTEISRLLGLELIYVPYVTNDCWVPDSAFYNVTFSSENGRSAAELALPEPLTFEEFEHSLKSSFSSSDTIRAPGIRTGFPGRDQPWNIQFIGRAF